MAALAKHTTWAMAEADESIASLQHPLFGTAFEKATFCEMFRTVLEQLDGASEADYVDFFFKRSPVEPSYLVYADDDCQEDFLDWVQEEGCMPSTEETRVGETDAEKATRLAKEEEAKQRAQEAKEAKAAADADAREIQRAKAAAEAAALEADPALKAARVIGTRAIGLESARAKAAKAKGDKQAKLQAKADSAFAALQAMADDFMAEFADRKDLLPELFGGEGNAMRKSATKGAAAAAASSGAGDA